MNMQQPDPGGLFEQFQGKRQQPPSNRSVVAQLDQQPAPPANIPPVQPVTPPPPPADTSEKVAPVNPFVALHQSGVMASAIAETEQPQQSQPPQGNPFLELYKTGAMTGGILEAEDQNYKQELETYEKRKKNYIPYPGMGAAADPQQPQAPARDMNTIQQNWNRGVHYLRGNELGHIFHRIETAQTTPEEDGFIASQLEPQLPPEIQQQLNLSRMTRSKFLDLQNQAQAEEQVAKDFQQDALFMLPGQIAKDPRFTQRKEQENVLGRNLAKTLTFNYAFAPDEERLNSDNPEVVAEERAKRAFYQSQDQDYPVTSLAGNILGAMVPIGVNIAAIRAGRAALAARSLAAGPPTARTAAVITSRAAPQTTAGVLTEGAAAGLPYDIVMRPEGSEGMTAEEKNRARLQQVGFGLSVGIAGDLLLTKGLPMLAKGGAKLADVLNIGKDARRQRELDTLSRENTEFETFEDLLNASTELVTDANGNQVLRLKTETLDVLPELETPVREGEHVQEQLPQETGTASADQGGLHDTIQPQPREGSHGDQAPPEPHTTEPTGAAHVEAPVTHNREPALIEHKLIEQADEIATAPAEPPVQEKVTGLQTVEAPLDELTLSADVPQFKSGADEGTGVVEPLGGTFDRTGVAPIQVWVRSDGRKEIISGRHRVDLARRSGEQTIPAQYHYESDGFGPQQAATMDALLNIREGQGKVKDYVDFIKASGITEAEADAQGILARATGKRAYTIATFGSDTLISAHRAGQLSDEAATRIAGAAPGNEKLQAVGIKALQDGKSITVAENMVKAVRSMTGDTGPTSSADMFGFDDSAMQEAERLARAAAAKQNEIQRTLSAVKGASKNPELAAKEGIDIRDKSALEQRIIALEQQKRDWNNWHTNPDLTAQLRGEPAPAPKAEPEVKPEEAPPTRSEEPEPQDSFNLTTHTEQELTTRETTAREAETAQQQEQQTLAAKAKADSEVADFELGIQGSGKDVSARQTDLLGLTRETPSPPPPKAEPEPEARTEPETDTGGEQHNRRSSAYETTVVEAEPTTVQAEAPVKEVVPEVKPVPEVKAEPAGETSYTKVTNSPDTTAKDMKGGPYTLDYHNQITKGIREGTLSVEDYQAAGRALLENKEEVMARLNKLPKNKLMAFSRKFYTYPRDVKKPEALQDAYNRLLNLYKSEKNVESGWEITKLPKQSDLEQSIRKAIDDTTQADLDDLTKRYTEHKTKREEAAAETKARIENPQTLADFELVIRENGKDSLSTAQRAEYERLNAESQWQAREQQEQAKKTRDAQTKGLETEQELEVEPITEATHTKTGATIYNVKLATRLDTEQFAKAAKTAKELGGNYYRGNFWLPDREKAEQFVSWLNGQTIDRTPDTMAKETAKADKNVSKLREMADKLEQQGEAEYNRERTTNTAKQMSQATSARADAQKKINFARTLRNIADGIEDGSIRFLSKLTSQTQLDVLNKIKRNAIPDDMIDSSYNGYSMNRTLKEGVTLEDYIDRITLPEISIHTDNVKKLIEAMKGKRGFADARKSLEEKLSAAIRSDKQHTINLQPHSVTAAKVDELVRKHKVDAGWLFDDTMARAKRIQKMGLTTDDQLRSAIRELEAVRSGGVMSANAEHKLDALRLKIKQNARNFNDFFPTPDDVVHRVMELADVQPGMKTLEPNTGMGHMAKQLQTAAGAENVDLVEISPQLIDYLKTAGFGDVTQADFMTFGVKGTYDRIVMNPPFSKNQDIDHVLHAYELLKPGGKMTAIVSNMAGLRTDKKNRAFSQWLDDVGAHVEDLEDGAFKSSFNPTGVKTKVLVIDKPAVEVKAEVEVKSQGTDLQVLEPVKLNKFQQTEKQNGGLGLAGELSDSVVSGLLAMRNNPNVPALQQHTRATSKGSFSYYTGKEEIQWHDIGKGISIRGYTQGGDVIQEVRFPSDMVMSRTLKKDGSLSGSFEGNYDQIVKGEGYAEIETFIKDYYNKKQEPAVPEIEAPKNIPVAQARTVVTPEEYHYKEAGEAFQHSNRSAPASHRESFVKSVQNLYDENLKLVKTPEQQRALDDAIEQYKKDYMDAEKKYFGVRSNTVSAHIAGRSKFDAARAERNYKADDNALATMAREINAAKDQVKQAIMDARPDTQKQADKIAAEAKAHEDKVLKHTVSVGKYIGGIADDLRNGRVHSAADYRKSVMPKAYQEVENALSIDREMTIQHLKWMDDGLQELGGLATVAGPRSKLAQLYKKLESEQKASTPSSPPHGATLYSTPIIPAAKQAAKLLHLNPGASTAGAIYGGIEGGDRSEEDKYSKNWWLDVARGAALGAVAGAAGVSALKTIPIKGKTILGEHSWGRKAYDITGNAIRKLPGMNPGDPDIIPLKKRQQLMKAIIEKQAEKAGEYLLKNFTPSQRSIMADLIEQRGIVADGNILHQQAKELDDFIGYTSTKLQELGMLADDIEPGGYLHRYYSKHLGLTGLARSLTPKGAAISGTWSRRRGTSEVYDSRYFSQSMRDTMDQIQTLRDEYNALKKQAGDLIDTDTQTRLDELKAQYRELEKTEFREYLAAENGQIKSFFLAQDEVPVIPGLQPQSTGLAPVQPGSQGTLGAMPPAPGKTGQLVLTDRRWTIDGKKSDNEGILHRDWTKAERESWGEITDAAYRMVRGQTEVAHDLSLATLFKTIDDTYNGTRVSDTEIEGWVQVPKTTVGQGSRLKKYGALEGKYVTPELWKSVKNHGRNPLTNIFASSKVLESAVPAVKAYLGTLQKWKAYKTVYNPVSHMNNAVSNLMMYQLSDYDNKHIWQAFKELRKGENSAAVAEAQRAGLFGTDWTSEISGTTGAKKIDELLEELRTQPEIPDFEPALDRVMKIKQWFIESTSAVKNAQGPWRTGAELAKAIGNPLINTARKPIKKAADAAQAAYRAEDELFRLAVYMAEREKGTRPFDAVRSAQNYFFDYSDMPDGMKLVRDLPIGSPFISYTYFAIPAIVRTAIEKPEKILGFVAALEGLNYAGLSLNGELQEQGYWDQMADEEALYPKWMQGRSLFGALNNVSIPFVESYKLSLANMLPAGNPFVGQSERPGYWPAVFSAFGQGPEGSNPFVKLIFDLSRNQDWKGSPIYAEGAPDSEKIRKAINYAYQNLAPSNPLFPGSYSQQKILGGFSNQVRQAEQDGEEPNRLIESIVDMANATSQVLGGEQFTGVDRRENEILTRDALLGSIGIKLRPVRPDQFEESKTMDIKSESNAIRKYQKSRERLYDEGRITDEQIESSRIHTEGRFFELDQELGRVMKAAR